MYSFAALPSMTRAAPAKKRRLSTVTGTSSIAAVTGLPAFLDSSRPISSARASRPSASLSSARLRSCGVLCCQVSKAVAAASTARSTSSAFEAGTLAMTLPSAGFSTSRVAPDAESTHWPPVNCWYVLTRSRTSVTGSPPGVAIGDLWSVRSSYAEAKGRLALRSRPTGGRRRLDDGPARPRDAFDQVRGADRSGVGLEPGGDRVQPPFERGVGQQLVDRVGQLVVAEVTGRQSPPE